MCQEGTWLEHLHILLSFPRVDLCTEHTLSLYMFVKYLNNMKTIDPSICYIDKYESFLKRFKTMIVFYRSSN